MYLFCKRWIKAVFILPTLLVFLAYTMYPLFNIIITSFKNVTHYTDYGFVGFDNWVALLSDERFYIALKNTLIVVLGELLIILPISILMGFFFYSAFKLNETIKVAAFTPYILSGVMVAIVWDFILNPGFGLYNSLVRSLGLNFLDVEMIGGTTFTPYSVALIDSWKSIGFFGVLFFTGLKMLPKDTFEAAVIDGATRFQKTILITLPLLKETIKISAVMVIMLAFNSFQTVKVLTDGGPNFSSHVITSFIYMLNWRSFDFGQGSAASLILFVLIMSISTGILVLTRKRIGD